MSDTVTISVELMGRRFSFACPLGEREAPEVLLERTRQYVQAAQDYLGEPRCELGPTP